MILSMLFLTACRVGTDRYELTNYLGKSVSTFEKRSQTELTKQSNGVYVMENVVQVMVPEKEVNAITLMQGADKYTIFGVGIGMTKADVDAKLFDLFGKEITKTTDESNQTVTYSYLKDNKELYISYNTNTEIVTGISYYLVDETKEEDKEEEKANNGELIAMIGDTRVYYNEAMVYLKSAQQDYENDYGNSIWGADILGNGETFGSMIKEEVIKQITELKIISAEAKKLEIALSEEELANANTYAKEHYEGLTVADRNKYLVTEELLRQVYSENLLAEKAFETLTINVDTEVTEQESKQITVQHIFIKSANYDAAGKVTPYTAQEKEEALAKVNTLLTQAKDTDDFYSLAEANSESETIEYTFGRKQGPKEYSDTFEQAAFSLKTGQVSDIITTDKGWHILYCVTDFNEDATIQVKENIIEERRNQMFAKLYEEWSANYDVIINTEAWGAVTYEDK